MNTSGPLPIFRSPAQGRILAWLLLTPEREQPIAALAPVAGLAQPNVLREVNRLVEAGLLAERRAGNTRLVSANTGSPYFEPLVSILGRAYGPAQTVPEELAGIPGVERLVLVGSWARRFAGEAGPPPRDLDVVVVGQPDRRAVRRANARLEERLGVPVQVTVVTSEEWEQQRSGFVREVRSRPHTELRSSDDARQAAGAGAGADADSDVNGDIDASARRGEPNGPSRPAPRGARLAESPR